MCFETNNLPLVTLFHQNTVKQTKFKAFCQFRTKICVFMGKTDPSAARHQQQSMVLVPFETPGINVLRPLSVFGMKDSPRNAFI